MADGDAGNTAWAAAESLVNILHQSRLVVTRSIDKEVLRFALGHIIIDGAPPAEVVQQLFALQRLALLAQDHESVWEGIVIELWQDAGTEAVEIMRFLKSHGGTTAAIGIMFVCDDAELNVLFNELAEFELQPDVGITISSTKGLAIPVVPIQPVFRLDVNLNTALASILDLTELARGGRQSRLVAIRSVLVRSTVKNAMGISKILSLAQQGILLTRFPVLDMDVNTSNGAMLVDTLQQLFASASRANIPEEPVRVVNIRARPDDEYDQASLMVMSATGSSSSVREVVCSLQHLGENVDAPEGLEFAHWLAYSIFSKDHDHLIRRLTVNGCPMRDRVVQCFEAVLGAEDPLVPLFEHQADSIRRHSSSRLSAKNLPSLPPRVPREKALLCRWTILSVIFVSLVIVAGGTECLCPDGAQHGCIKMMRRSLNGLLNEVSIRYQN